MGMVTEGISLQKVAYRKSPTGNSVSYLGAFESNLQIYIYEGAVDIKESILNMMSNGNFALWKWMG